jgi:hypothetical protein
VSDGLFSTFFALSRPPTKPAALLNYGSARKFGDATAFGGMNETINRFDMLVADPPDIAPVKLDPVAQNRVKMGRVQRFQVFQIEIARFRQLLTNRIGAVCFQRRPGPEHFGSLAERFDDLWIRLLKHRDKNFPNPNAAEIQILVHWITTEIHLVFQTEILGVPAFRPVDKRAAEDYGRFLKWKPWVSHRCGRI